MRDLERRVQRLEAERGADEEATLEEAILWSYRLEDEPFDPETQRQYDDFCRRCARRSGRLGCHAPRPESSDPAAGATAFAAPARPAVTARQPAASIPHAKPINPDPPPAPEFSRGMDGPGAWIRERFDQSFNGRRGFPEPGQSLDSWMAAQRAYRNPNG